MAQASESSGGKRRPDGARAPTSAGEIKAGGEDATFAALDLGTNNCRLLIARPAVEGFRIVEAYSNIVRLGEGLSQTGRLADHAMDRAIEALRICAEKIGRRRCVRVRAVATQACRSAENGEAFIERVRQETGIRLQIISPREEAYLAVAGCLNLLDRQARAALVIDVGGGSTELSWVDLTGRLEVDPRRFQPQRLPVRAHFNVMVWSSDSARLREMQNRVASAMASIDAAAKQETVGAAQIWWAGIPGNAAAFPINDTFETFAEQACCFLSQESNYKSSSPEQGVRFCDRISSLPSSSTSSSIRSPLPAR